METQFRWFFDAAAISVLLVSIYLSGKRGFSKTVVITIGYILSLTAAAIFSGRAADLIYDKCVKQRCEAQIMNALENVNMPQKTKVYIESLGYGIKPEDTSIAEIFGIGGDVNEQIYEYVNSLENRPVDDYETFSAKLSEGFGEMTGTLIGEEMNRYAASEAAKLIGGDPKGFGEALRLIQIGDRSKAAAYIAENYTADAVKDIIKVFCFITILFILTTAIKAISHKLGGIKPPGDISDHILGGVLGAAEGLMIIFLCAAAVRILVVLGNDEMLLFNSKIINETSLFRHIYRLTMKI